MREMKCEMFIRVGFGVQSPDITNKRARAL